MGGAAGAGAGNFPGGVGDFFAAVCADCGDGGGLSHGAGCRSDREFSGSPGVVVVLFAGDSSAGSGAANIGTAGVEVQRSIDLGGGCFISGTLSGRVAGVVLGL